MNKSSKFSPLFVSFSIVLASAPQAALAQFVVRPVIVPAEVSGAAAARVTGVTGVSVAGFAPLAPPASLNAAVAPIDAEFSAPAPAPTPAAAAAAVAVPAPATAPTAASWPKETPAGTAGRAGLARPISAALGRFPAADSPRDMSRDVENSRRLFDGGAGAGDASASTPEEGADVAARVRLGVPSTAARASAPTSPMESAASETTGIFSGTWHKISGYGDDQVKVINSGAGVRVDGEKYTLASFWNINGPTLNDEPWRGSLEAPGGLVTRAQTTSFSGGKLEWRSVRTVTHAFLWPNQFVERRSLVLRGGNLVMKTESTLYRRKFFYFGLFNTRTRVNTTNLADPERPKQTTIYERVAPGGAQEAAPVERQAVKDLVTDLYRRDVAESEVIVLRLRALAENTQDEDVRRAVILGLIAEMKKSDNAGYIEHVVGALEGISAATPFGDIRAMIAQAIKSDDAWNSARAGSGEAAGENGAPRPKSAMRTFTNNIFTDLYAAAIFASAGAVIGGLFALSTPLVLAAPLAVAGVVLFNKAASDHSFAVATGRLIPGKAAEDAAASGIRRSKRIAIGGFAALAAAAGLWTFGSTPLIGLPLAALGVAVLAKARAALTRSDSFGARSGAAPSADEQESARSDSEYYFGQATRYAVGGTALLGAGAAAAFSVPAVVAGAALGVLLGGYVVSALAYSEIVHRSEKRSGARDE
ncbi:MAG: hypothetical protein KGJ84_05125 [Elusimicrobia bacterium]|nr:hypothetical protein [Elusimicrobiota bacterium]